MKQVGHRGTCSHRPLTRLVAGIAGAFMAVGALASANSVQADSVWVQSYERTSQTQECVAQSWETPWQAAWGSDSSWKPSWEQWANGGTGGWTCTRSLVWARSEGVTYQLGDIGPGGGLVFLIAGGLTYEMAPKDWAEDPPNPDKLAQTCDSDTTIPEATRTAIGTGAANTAAIVAKCTSGASNDAAAYRGGRFTDWFLPSRDELNAMCNYSRNPTAPAGASVACSGAQDATFASGSYGFGLLANNDFYWSSSIAIQFNNGAWAQDFYDADRAEYSWNSSLNVRPIRAS